MILSTAAIVPKISFSFDSEIPFSYIARHMECWSGRLRHSNLSGLRNRYGGVGWLRARRT